MFSRVTVIGAAFGAVIVVTLPGMLVHWLLRVVVNDSRTLKYDIILKHKLHSFIVGRSDSYHLPQLQFAREHTCFSGFGSGFVVLPMMFTAPLDLTAAFGCGMHKQDVCKFAVRTVSQADPMSPRAVPSLPVATSQERHASHHLPD